ncbi:MAG: hypothetical protein K5682_08400 [Lachnospiraceae bacterium]|nr:hypothetical protein [Lachnospiraceae bacterium]
MIDPQNFNNLNYIKKEPLSGSDSGLRYLMECIPKDEDTKVLKVTVWPEPFGYHATPDDQKTIMEFPLNADGLADAVMWVNEQYPRIKAMVKDLM